MPLVKRQGTLKEEDYERPSVESQDMETPVDSSQSEHESWTFDLYSDVIFDANSNLPQGLRHPLFWNALAENKVHKLLWAALAKIKFHKFWYNVFDYCEHTDLQFWLR